MQERVEEKDNDGNKENSRGDDGDDEDANGAILRRLYSDQNAENVCCSVDLRSIAGFVRLRDVFFEAVTVGCSLDQGCSIERRWKI
jgi:hypothetical protein